MERHSLFIFLTLCYAYALARAADPLANGPQFTSTTRTFTGFKTEPTFVLENFEVQRIPHDRSLLSPGYIFMNAMVKSPRYGFGLSIYTEEGELIWRGRQEKLAQNLHVCDYLGSKGTHLCYYTRWVRHRIPILPEGERLGTPRTTYGRLFILDNTYKSVQMLKHGFDELAVNGHAFETHDNGFSATTILARPRAINLRKHGGPKEGWVLNQCLQEFDLPSGEDSFHWCYYESGLSVWESKLIPFMGNPGLKNAWDFLHTNAIAKNSEGDFFISARHADVLIKVAGKNNRHGAKPGEVIWRLGGKSNDFKMIGFNSEQGFTRQHDVQVLSTNGTKEVISIFNNAFDRLTGPSQEYSDGQIISIDMETMQATRTHTYPHPRRSQGRKESLSDGRGSMQVLPNGNALVGWGVLPDFTEFSENGTVLYHTNYSRKAWTIGREFSYRVYKAPWVGKPHWDPKLVAYTLDCKRKSPLTAYVSHNGATEIKNWRFKAAMTANGPWVDMGTVPKRGFETKAHLKKVFDFVPFVSAEALDSNGSLLGSTISEVFVPKENIKRHCRRDSCQRDFVYSQEHSKADHCYVKPPPSSADKPLFDSTDKPAPSSPNEASIGSTDTHPSSPPDEPPHASPDKPTPASPDEPSVDSTGEPALSSTNKPDMDLPDQPAIDSVDKPSDSTTDKPPLASVDEPYLASTDKSPLSPPSEQPLSSTDELPHTSILHFPMSSYVVLVMLCFLIVIPIWTAQRFFHRIPSAIVRRIILT